MSEVSRHELTLKDQVESYTKIGRWNMTLGVDDFEVPKEGYVYVANTTDSKILPKEHVAGWGGLEGELAEFIDKNYKDKLKTGEFFVGVWEDDGGFYHFDLVKVAKSEAEAIEKAGANGQQAIYDLKNKNVIYLNK